MYRCEKCGRNVVGSPHIVTLYRECEDDQFEIRYNKQINKNVRYLIRTLAWREPAKEIRLCSVCADTSTTGDSEPGIPACHCFGPQYIPVEMVAERLSCKNCEKRERKTNGAVTYVDMPFSSTLVRTSARDIWTYELMKHQSRIDRILERVKALYKNGLISDEECLDELDEPECPSYEELLFRYVPHAILIRYAELRSFLGIGDNRYLNEIVDRLYSQELTHDADQWHRFFDSYYGMIPAQTGPVPVMDRERPYERAWARAREERRAMCEEMTWQWSRSTPPSGEWVEDDDRRYRRNRDRYED